MSTAAQSTPAASRYGLALFEAAKSQSALDAVKRWKDAVMMRFQPKEKKNTDYLSYLP